MFIYNLFPILILAKSHPPALLLGCMVNTDAKKAPEV